MYSRLAYRLLLKNKSWGVQTLQSFLILCVSIRTWTEGFANYSPHWASVDAPRIYSRVSVTRLIGVLCGAPAAPDCWMSESSERRLSFTSQENTWKSIGNVSLPLLRYFWDLMDRGRLYHYNLSGCKAAAFYFYYGKTATKEKKIRAAYQKSKNLYSCGKNYSILHSNFCNLRT